MIRESPLVIFCSPRGGSSLVAGVFVHHGFWIGKPWGDRDYLKYENALIKDFFKEHWKLRAGEHDYDPLNADLRAFVRDTVQPKGNWLYKAPSEYHGVFEHHFPDLTPVFVFRDPIQAVEAHVRRYGESVRDGASRIVTARYAYMNRQLAKGKGFRVDCERVADGDYAQIEPILAEYGIALDHRAAATGIDPQMLTRTAS